jgi:hypothetical protein
MGRHRIFGGQVKYPEISDGNFPSRLHIGYSIITGNDSDQSQSLIATPTTRKRLYALWL